MAYSVGERTREIGIRMALGAGSREVLKMVIGHAFLLISLGCANGLAGSFALTRSISSGLYGVTATDPATYLGISVLLIVVALIACAIPTIRAVRVDPTIALGYKARVNHAFLENIKQDGWSIAIRIDSCGCRVVRRSFDIRN